MPGTDAGISTTWYGKEFFCCSLICFVISFMCTVRSLVRRISTRPAGTLLDGARRGGGGEGGGRLLLPSSEDEATRALLLPCSTSPPGKGTGAARHGKRGAVDRPGAVSRLNINGIF